jgi:hypothetical protein
MGIIFDAECMKCKTRKGIELPETINAQIAIMQCNMINAHQNCKCGGYVDIQVYRGRLDEKRNVVNE